VTIFKRKPKKKGARGDRSGGKEEFSWRTKLQSAQPYHNLEEEKRLANSFTEGGKKRTIVEKNFHWGGWG